MPPFIYNELEKPSSQIRLFKIVPKTGHRLEGTLIHVDLDAAHGTYDALSYCWGEDEAQLPILVNGCSFYISPNLHDALKNILRQYKLQHGGPGEIPHLVMWIDALCIDQDDTDEKNAQVPMMRHIYANSRRTYAWLGPHDAWTALAFRQLRMRSAWERERQKNQESQVSGIGWWRWRQIHQHHRSNNSPEVRRRHDDTARENNYYYNELEDEQGPTDGFLTRLISKERVPISQFLLGTGSVLYRDWFTRCWVVQEMATSKCITLVCGKYHMNWKDVELAFKSASTSLNNTNHSGTFIEVLIAIRQSLHNADHTSLETLLWSTNTFQASDPRDRIFSLFGLINPNHEHDPDTSSDSSHRTGHITTVDTGVRIDYGASIRDVYIETTIQCLRTSGHAGILAGCLGTRGTWSLDYEFPSWVLNPDPSFSDPTGSTSFAWAPPKLPNAGGWKASGLSSRCEPVLDKENTLLGLQGIIVDTIAQTGMVWKGSSRGALAGGMARDIKCYMQWRALSRVPTSRAAREATFYRGTNKTTHQAFLEIMCPRLPINCGDEASLAENHWALCRQFDHFMTSNFGFLEHKESTRDNTKPGKIDAWRIAAKIIKLLGQARFGNREDVAQGADFVTSNQFAFKRRFLRTKGGYIGLGGTHASVGDQVVLFAGSPAPFLIRESEPTDNSSSEPSSLGLVRYRLICDAYFVGMMAGELWDSDTCETIWLE